MRATFLAALLCVGCCDERPVFIEQPRPRPPQTWVTYKVVLNYQDEHNKWFTTVEREVGKRRVLQGKLGNAGDVIKILERVDY